MALTKCADCDGDVSDKAPACPRCGCPTSRTSPDPEPRPASAPAEVQVGSGPSSSGPAPKSEESLFTNGRALVTTSRAVIDQKTYSVANISSVSSARVEPSGLIPAALIILGGFCVMLTVVSVSQWGGRDGSPGASLCVAIVAAALIFGGVSLKRAAKPTFFLRITTSGGEVEALRTKDGVLLDGLVKSLDEAIARR